MREDPHAGYVPGQGCGCSLCREPLIEVEIPTAEVQAARRDAYVAYRRGHLSMLGYAETLGRGPAYKESQE
jgi:hypothetical protein